MAGNPNVMSGSGGFDIEDSLGACVAPQPNRGARIRGGKPDRPAAIARLPGPDAQLVHRPQWEALVKDAARP
jgi:hypothetical protein